MTRFWKAAVWMLMLGLLAAACSDDDSTSAGDESEDANGSETTEAEAEPEDTEPETTEAEAEPETTEAEAEPETTEAEADPEDTAEGSDDPAAETTAVGLGEWFVDTPATMAPGTITFSVSNSGENPHAFAIVRGVSYEELPQLDNGAVDTDALGADFLGATDNLMTGDSTEIEFELEAGDYVFFCPIQFGPNSHAAAGQVLSVTVG